MLVKNKFCDSYLDFYNSLQILDVPLWSVLTFCQAYSATKSIFNSDNDLRTGHSNINHLSWLISIYLNILITEDKCTEDKCTAFLVRASDISRGRGAAKFR